MTRIRQSLVTIVLAAFLALSFNSLASADPGDGGGGHTMSKGPYTRTSDPGDGGVGP
jgi:hypothetical protein